MKEGEEVVEVKTLLGLDKEAGWSESQSEVGRRWC
jgi:hypothetical protein